VWVVHRIFIRYFEQNVQRPDETQPRLIYKALGGQNSTDLETHCHSLHSSISILQLQNPISDGDIRCREEVSKRLAHDVWQGGSQMSR
jgi:hypothetical protein